MRLNLGCGPGPVLANTYIYVDASRKLLLAKIPLLSFLVTRTFGFENSWDSKVKFKNILKWKLQPNSVEFAYSSHLLEHLYYNQSKHLLRMIHESLISGGRIRLALPDYDAFISKYNEVFRFDQALAMQELESSLLSHPLDKPSFFHQIWKKLTGDLHVHRWHPNYALVRQMLIELGYKEVSRHKFRESSLEEIQSLENREFLTFYIEATK